MTAKKAATKQDEAPDLGQDKVQEKVDAVEDTGVLGQKVDPRPDSEYSLKSGPESPSATAGIHTRFEQVGATDQKKES